MALLARLAPWAGAVLAGLLQALSLAWPGNGQPLWWLQVLSLGALAGLVYRQSAWRGAAGLGWLFATGWLTGTWWWLFISMHVYGGLAAPLAALAVVLLAGFLALYYAAAAGLFALAAQRRPWRDAALFGALWMGAELLRGTLFTGFPWGAGGYAHVDGPLASLAPWVGVYGMTAVAAWLACLLALLVQRPVRGSWRYWVAWFAAATLLAACNVQQAAPSAAPGARLKVALLQGNIPQDEKFETGTGVPIALEWYARRLQDAGADLVVAPETAIPLLPQQLPEGYYDALRGAFATGERAALVGIPMGNFDDGYTNSTLGFRPGGAAPYRYDKHHLVPFGEFIPPLFKWFTRMMNIPLGDFNRGGVGQASFEWKGQWLAPNICYEDLFGEELAARFRDPSRAPTIYVNRSNIGWFGDTVAIDQHLHISRLRALEFRRPMIRATNTGATAIIDRFGRVTHVLQRHTRGVLVGEVEGGTGMTPFAHWASRFGLWPLWIVALAATLAAWLGRRRTPQP